MVSRSNRPYERINANILPHIATGVGKQIFISLGKGETVHFKKKVVHFLFAIMAEGGMKLELGLDRGQRFEPVQHSPPGSPSLFVGFPGDVNSVDINGEKYLRLSACTSGNCFLNF